MVGNSLKISDHFQQFGRFLAIRQIHLFRTESDQISAQNILVVVGIGFILPDGLG